MHFIHILLIYSVLPKISAWSRVSVKKASRLTDKMRPSIELTYLCLTFI